MKKQENKRHTGVYRQSYQNGSLKVEPVSFEELYGDGRFDRFKFKVGDFLEITNEKKEKIETLKRFMEYKLGNCPL